MPLKKILTDDLSYFHEKPALICLDEFQFAKTLDKHENELGKDKLRVVWDLLDSGKIQYIPDSGTYYLFRADNCLKRLEKSIGEGLVMTDGKIESGLEAFQKNFNGFYFEYSNRLGAKMSEEYFLSEDFVMGAFYLFDDEEFTKEEIRDRIKSATAPEIMLLLKQGMNTRPATKTLDLSRCVIFVLGNLDEAYSMSHNMNPDISADEFHEQTSKITIADIKRALRKRFRPEQIARLGNNHIIYRSFNSAQFRMLIRQELNRVAAFVSNRFGWKIAFDDSVVNIVYAEGVFPAQGTRPVLTTVKNLIESKISSLIVTILEYQLTASEIVWKYDNAEFVYQVTDDQNNVLSTISDTAKLKLENLRKSVDPEIQAHVAVHEAGHAVLAALTLRIIPSVVVSRTASDMEGFCLVNFPKGPMTRDSLKKDIVITLGGYVAEKMIFGEELTTSGVYSDIEEASRLANKAVRKYAMGGDPIHISIESLNEDAFYLTQKYSAEAISIIKACELEAEALLQRNKLALLKIAEYLTTNSRMEEEMIERFMKDYAEEPWVRTDGFIKKDQYYKFNAALQNELTKTQNAGLSFDIEKIMSEVNVDSVI